MKKMFVWGALGVLALVCLGGVAIWAASGGLQDWAEFNLDVPAQDCLMNTVSFAGQINDQTGNPIPNAQVKITGRHLACENGVRFAPVTTDANGDFSGSQTLYSPLLKNAQGLNPTESYALTRFGGTYEIEVNAPGYAPYDRPDAIDRDIFDGLTVVLQKQP
jgi:hypothetical protein